MLNTSYLVYKVATFVLLIGLLAGCVKEVALPVTASFDVQVSNNYTIPATVSVTNTTEGGEIFSWTFEGGDPATSTKKSPGEVVYRKAGTYTIRLVASNVDGSQSVVEKQIIIDSKLSANFSFSVIGDTYAPAQVSFANLSSGYEKLEWTFEGGTPATSSQPDPIVTFDTGGDHKISLKLFSTHSTIVKDTTLSLAPELMPDFDIVIPAQYEELEAPVALQLANKSVGNTTNRWTLSGAETSQSQQAEPTVRYAKAGLYTLTLEVSNGKKTKTLSKTITVRPSKGYAYIKDVELGIFSARNSVGVYYSTLLRKTYKASDTVSGSEASTIDLLFLGLNDSFSYNQFRSPDEAALAGLPVIVGVGKTTILNPEQVNSSLVFENLDEAQLRALQLNTPGSETDPFFTESSPRLLLFENAQHKKGVIQIKEFIKDGPDSRIRVDIKVLK